MSDPTTLLLLTCATCTEPPTPPERVEEPTSIHQPGHRSPNTPTPSLNSISSPEISPSDSHAGVLRTAQASPLLSLAPEVAPSPPVEHSRVEWTSAPESTSSQAATAPSNPIFILRLGSQGDPVRQLQQQLQQLGYYSGSLDGVYGRLTQNAVQTFQKAQGIQPDGIAGPITGERLRQAAESEPLLSSTASATAPLPSQQERITVSVANPSPIPSAATRQQVNSSVSAQSVSSRSLAPPTRLEAPLSFKNDTDQKTALVLFEAKPDYLWLVAWAVVYIGGWAVLLRTHRQDLTGFHFTQSVGTPPSEQETADGSPNHAHPHETVVAAGAYPAQGTATAEGGITPFIFQTPGSLQSTDTLPILDAEPFSEVTQAAGEPIALTEEDPSEFDNSVSEPIEPSLPITWADEGVVEALDGLFAELANFVGDDEAIAPDDEEGDRDDTRTIRSPWIDPEVGSTIIGVLPPHSETGDPYTYALVNNAGGAFILDGYDLRITDDALLAIQGDISYIVTVRRTDAQGEQADKSFVVSLSKAEAEELRHGNEELAHSA